MSTPASAVDVRRVAFRYGDRAALEDVSLHVAAGEAFALLGPNGSGKTTLFRILCTLLPLQDGDATVAGCDLRTDPFGVRRSVGVTFQSPSLDGKLTVRENLKHQAQLYGVNGRALRERVDELLEQFGLASRRDDVVDELSGGLKRRVELAKGLLHRPELLLLDEPSTGLDPSARNELWEQLALLRDSGVTILVATHLMEEAEHCDRVAILDAGRLVAAGPPQELRSELGGDGVTIHARRPDELAGRIAERFHVTPRKIGAALRIELDGSRDFLADLMDEFAGDVRSLEFGKPTLEDVFIAKTGRRFDEPT